MRSTALLPSPRRLLAATAAAAALTFGAAPVAFAAPGDNGDVKVHDSSTDENNQNDDPKVCTFYFDAFNFDTVTLVSWTVEQQPPTGNALVLAGSLVLTDGHGRTTDYSLPDGHYRLNWTFAGENGSAKHKVFDVQCATSSPSPSNSPSPSSSPSPTKSPSPSTSPSPSPSPGVSPSHSPGHSPKPGPHGGVGTGGGGTSGSNTAEVLGGSALIAGAAWFGIRSLRRRAGRNAQS
ncbi:hypothetical protein ACFVHB_21555 [Kitasatospora sp. NPDC127111]|uniref:hypothetical protein n=1 Tax=Kitasatospora sp. NPDC127111 TaxID=3345363 RepID=UPI00363ECB43